MFIVNLIRYVDIPYQNTFQYVHYRSIGFCIFAPGDVTRFEENNAFLL